MPYKLLTRFLCNQIGKIIKNECFEPQFIMPLVRIDYENEISLFQFNHTIDSSIDTFVLFPSSNNLFLSSSSIKELVKFNSDISPYVPAELVEYIRDKINNNMYKKHK